MGGLLRRDLECGVLDTVVAGPPRKLELDDNP